VPQDGARAGAEGTTLVEKSGTSISWTPGLTNAGGPDEDTYKSQFCTRDGVSQM